MLGGIHEKIAFVLRRADGAAGRVRRGRIAPEQSWSLFSGYHRNEPKTVGLRNLWSHSGDAGVMDEASRRRGESISADEVEGVAESDPAIVESAAFGFRSPLTDEDIMIVAMRRSGSALAPPDLLAHFRASAPRHMVPRYIKITDATLPRTLTEKIAATCCVPGA